MRPEISPGQRKERISGMIATIANEPQAKRPGPTLSVRIRSLRAFSLPLSVAPVLVATAAAVAVAHWRWDVLLVSMLGAAALHLAGNLLNDLFDFRNGVDRRVQGDEGRPGRVLVYGLMRPAEVAKEAAAAGAVSLAAAGYILWRCGPMPLAFAAAGAIILYAYTGPPLALKYRGVGEWAIFLAFGPLLMVGAAWAQVGAFCLPALLLSLPLGCVTTAVLVGNNLRDRQEDAQAGIRTLGHSAGGRVAQILYIALVLVGGLFPAAMALTGLGPRGLLLAPLSLLAAVRPLWAVGRGQRVANIDSQTAGFVTLLSVLLLAVYVVQGPGR
jgi:1,4-dihydroxy-2-naphthoate octaprenyltransferase